MIVDNIILNDHINHAIEKGINFLYRNQLRNGEFATCVSTDSSMLKECSFDSSIFITTLILYSMGFFQNDKTLKIINNGLDFLIQEMEPNYTWRYWTKRSNSIHGGIVADLDDTACASFIIKKYKPTFKIDNHDIFINNRNHEGLFYTWIIEHKNIKLEVNANKLFGIWTMEHGVNDIDSVVNSNILLYLGATNFTSSVTNHLIKLLIDGNEKLSYYHYVDNWSLYYSISRAFYNGHSNFDKCMKSIINKILEVQMNDGSFGNALITSLAVCILLNFNYNNECVLDKAILSLLRMQNNSGLWQKHPFYLARFGDKTFYFGSEELTTGFCIEALSRYVILKNNNTY